MSLPRRGAILFTAAALALGLAGSVQAQSGAAPSYHEFIYGNPTAKVTVIEYASLTCPHCAQFENDIFPQIKKNYLDTNKIRYVFRDYPLDGLAMAAAALARCAPEDRGKKMVEMMYKNQADWMRAPQPIEPLKQYAALAGMTPADADACLKNETILKTIKDGQTKATSLYQVQSTPTFFIDEEKLEGDRGYDYMAKIIDKHIDKAK